MALAVDENLRAVSFEHLVTEPRLLLPREGVAQAGAPAAFDADAQAALTDALLGHQRFDLLRRAFCDFDHGSQRRGCCASPGLRFSCRGGLAMAGPPRPSDPPTLRPTAARGCRPSPRPGPRPAFSCNPQSPP